MQGARKVLFIVTLFLLNIMIMHDFVIFPITDALYAAFPDSTAGVNFIISGPSIVLVIASFIVPLVLRKIDKKTLLIIGGILYAVTAVGGCLIESVAYMSFCRACSGIAYAIAQICAVGLIADYWMDEDKRAAFVGYFNAAQAAVGAVMGFVSGQLAVVSWQNAYNTYWIAVPLVILIILFIPRASSAAVAAQETEGAATAGDTGRGLGASFWVMVLTFVLVTIAYVTTMSYFISVYVAENAMGDAAFAGTLNSIMAIGSMVMCIVFGFVYSKLNMRTSIPFFFTMAAAILALFLVHDQTVAMISVFVGGGSYGCLIAYAYAEGSIRVPAASVDRASGIVTAAYGVACFAATYIETAIMEAMATDMVSPTYIVFVVMCVVAAVIEIARVARAQS